MIEANVQILEQRVSKESMAADAIRQLLGTFVTIRDTLDNVWTDTDMTAGQKQGALDELTALAADLQARRTAVDEAFTATDPLPDDPPE